MWPCSSLISISLRGLRLLLIWFLRSAKGVADEARRARPDLEFLFPRGGGGRARVFQRGRTRRHARAGLPGRQGLPGDARRSGRFCRRLGAFVARRLSRMAGRQAAVRAGARHVLVSRHARRSRRQARRCQYRSRAKHWRRAMGRDGSAPAVDRSRPRPRARRGKDRSGTGRLGNQRQFRADRRQGARRRQDRWVLGQRHGRRSRSAARCRHRRSRCAPRRRAETVLQLHDGFARSDRSADRPLSRDRRCGSPRNRQDPSGAESRSRTCRRGRPQAVSARRSDADYRADPPRSALLRRHDLARLCRGHEPIRTRRRHPQRRCPLRTRRRHPLWAIVADLTASAHDRSMAYIYRMSAMAEWEIKSRIADPIVLSALRELDRRLRERFDGKYLKLLLFGSRARGDNVPESDADVAVIFRGRITDRWSLKRLLIEETYAILLESGLYIQPWPLEEDGLGNPDKSSNPALLRNVVREGISL